MSDSRSDALSVIEEAARRGVAVRLRISDGEVLVARILDAGPKRVVYRVMTSSRPEKYAVCDATGFSVPLEAITRAVILDAGSGPRGRASRRRGRGGRKV
jgi:hypothetical protein